LADGDKTISTVYVKFLIPRQIPLRQQFTGSRPIDVARAIDPCE